MPNGGRLAIATTEMNVLNREIRGNVTVEPGHYGVIEVSDNGVGMDKEETCNHIFEPFYTTKEVGKGTGLGLSMVYGIVQKHNGIISVDSKQGVGTKFSVFLPIMEVQAPSRKESSLEDGPRGNETILLIEDDDTVRNLLEMWLKEYGYRVVTAQDGEQGVKTFRDNHDKIDMLVTDIIMPKMNGREAYAEICGIKPNIPVLYICGYSANILSEKGIYQDATNYVSKPVNMKLFLEKTREQLESR